MNGGCWNGSNLFLRHCAICVSVANTIDLQVHHYLKSLDRCCGANKAGNKCLGGLGDAQRIWLVRDLAGTSGEDMTAVWARPTSNSGVVIVIVGDPRATFWTCDSQQWWCTSICTGSHATGHVGVPHQVLSWRYIPVGEHEVGRGGDNRTDGRPVGKDPV